jgi:hypothetical protein
MRNMATPTKMFALTKPYLRALGMRTWQELAEKDFVRNAAKDQKIVLKFDWIIKFQGRTTSGTSECYIHRGDLLIRVAKERYVARAAKESAVKKSMLNRVTG